jgi:hypothetical protein
LRYNYVDDEKLKDFLSTFGVRVNIMEDPHGKFNTDRNAEFERVLGLPFNDTVYNIDSDALYGVSFNISGIGWLSRVCSWDFAEGMSQGLYGCCMAPNRHHSRDFADGILYGTDACARVLDRDICISIVFFELDDNQQPKAVISEARKVTGLGCFTYYTGLTDLEHGVEPLQFNAD